MVTPVISFVSAAAAFAMALTVLWRGPRVFTHRVFALGMGLFAVDAVLVGVVPLLSSPDDVFYLQQVKLFVASLIPAVWLVFSLTFARSDHREFLFHWKWILMGCVAFGPAVAFFFKDELFAGLPVYDESLRVFLKLGWSGYLLRLFALVVNVLILMNLERAFRNSTGHMRWQIKFLILGLGGLFGVRTYTGSQSVLFRLLDTNFEVVNTFALLIANVMIVRSLSRTRALQFDFYISHTFLYNSFTVLVVGVYFVVVGVVARIAYHFKSLANPSIVALLVLLSILGIAVVMLSDKLRFKRKQFISHHFKRPVYDYQKVWSGFTENTTSISNIQDLCLAITGLVSHTLDVLAVSLWLVDERKESLSLGSSTMLSLSQFREQNMSSEMGGDLIRVMSLRSVPVELEDRDDEPIRQLKEKYDENLKGLRIDCCVPIRSAGQLLGILTLGKKVMNQELTFEDHELLRTIADQAGASLLNLRLSERLRQAKELEAFQVMSAFFVHDLKNLASKLSLVNQNMPVHFENEEFRQDASQTMNQCVEKIKGMCSRLSLLSQTLRLDRREVDLNESIARTVEGMNGQFAGRVIVEFGDLPLLDLDDEQVQKVFLNLLINANEAVGCDGQITLITSCNQGQGWVEVSVSDNGCGMSREFMDKYLFKPFQTTKQQGMGIGLFHCKTIVEAHGGRIQVESEEGKGTTVRVCLPIAYKG